MNFTQQHFPKEAPDLLVRTGLSMRWRKTMIKVFLITIMTCLASACDGQSPKSQPTTPEHLVPEQPAPTPSTTNETKGIAVETCKELVIQMPVDNFRVPTDRLVDLQTLADCLAKTPQIRVQLEGNVRAVGTPGYAMSHGESMAESVKKTLQQMGLDAKRISTISYGRYRPVCELKTPECDQENHRVEVRLSE